MKHAYVMEEAPSSQELVASPIPASVNARELCRLWRQAIADVGGSAAATQQLPPWVVLPDGRILTSTDGRMHFRPASFPPKATCVGSTDSWLALVSVSGENRHSYMLYNPFSETTVPLPELDAIIGEVPKSFKIRKVLMRSTPNDIIVVMPNNKNYPIILVRPGKSAWVPEPNISPFTRIIDVAFLGGILYGITQAEDLFVLDVAFDVNGVPTVTGTRRVIECWTKVDGSEVWNNYDESDNDDNDDEEEEEEDMDEIFDGTVYEIKHDEVPTQSELFITTTWHLVESRGKLLMLRRKLLLTSLHLPYTQAVEAFEADMSACSWVPVANELGGHTVFISGPFSKSVPAARESEEDAIHFIDTRDTFNMRFQTTIAPFYDHDYTKLVRPFTMKWEQYTWLFPPEPVA